MKNKILNTSLLPGQIALFYLGQVGYIVKFRDTYILIDGYLSDYVDQNCCSENVTWVRRYSAPIDAKELDFIDYVFCTHDHYDHMDPWTLSVIHSVNSKAKFLTSKAIEDSYLDRGVSKDRIVGLSCDKTVELCDGISVTAIPVAHEELHPTSKGEYKEVGYLFNFDGLTLFHGGDACPCDGLEEKLMGCEILILPINGRDYYRRYVCDIIGCFDSGEAITLANHTGAKMLIPTHFDLYDVNCVNPAVFVDKISSFDTAPAYHIFSPGERLIYAK